MVGDIAILERPDQHHILEELQTFKGKKNKNQNQKKQKLLLKF